MPQASRRGDADDYARYHDWASYHDWTSYHGASYRGNSQRDWSD
ncbi:MAG: hypothetical protein WD847_19800 [Pirellulales bacterium]